LAHFIFIINYHCEAAGKMGVLPNVYGRMYYETEILIVFGAGELQYPGWGTILKNKKRKL